MRKVQLLDCTLRDGGYVNNWEFGEYELVNIIKNLEKANLDIIECGFIRNSSYSRERSIYSTMEQLANIVKSKKKNTLYAIMIEYHNHVENRIPEYDGTAADVIRLTFRKGEWDGTKNVAQELINKGYKVCIQPVGTTAYDDVTLLSMVHDINKLKPYAFYLVDTLGMMYRKDIRRMYYLIDHNLSREILLGFHSHNNLQMSFANAQEFIRLATNRSVIIDTSCYGMGRGVGNLPTELLADYINNDIEEKYMISPILSNIDRYIMPIYARQRWGYDLPYFISGTLRCHPNYASFLMSKDVLDINGIEKILASLNEEDRKVYNEELISKKYLDYQKMEINDLEAIKTLHNIINNRDVLILGSGYSMESESETINSFIKNSDLYIISINYIPKDYEIDAVFISNRKRLTDILEDKTKKKNKIFMTSNLQHKGIADLEFNYSDLLGEGDALDNAGAMLIRLLKKIKIKKIYLAGIDGYSADLLENYYVKSYVKTLDYDSALKKNHDISRQLKNALDGVKYEIITKTRYEI